MSLSYTTGNPNNLTAGATASMNDIQGPFTDIKTFLTDGSGSVGDTILASPTNAVWRPVLTCAGNLNANLLQLTTAVFYFVHSQTIQSGVSTPGAVQGLWVPATSDVAVTGKTTRLRLRVPWMTNATAPGINITWGLYPLSTVAGASGAITPTLGTVVAGSAVTATTPAGSTGSISTGASFDISAVVSGNPYLIGVTGSGTQAAASVVGSQPVLEMRHT